MIYPMPASLFTLMCKKCLPSLWDHIVPSVSTMCCDICLSKSGSNEKYLIPISIEEARYEVWIAQYTGK